MAQYRPRGNGELPKLLARGGGAADRSMHPEARHELQNLFLVCLWLPRAVLHRAG